MGTSLRDSYNAAKRYSLGSKPRKKYYVVRSGVDPKYTFALSYAQLEKSDKVLGAFKNGKRTGFKKLR